MIGNERHEGGFTLIELMTAIGVFAVVVTLMSGMFISSLRGQEKGFVSQNVADNIRYVMEVMAKEIRMGSGFSVACAPAPCIEFTSNMPNRNGAPIRFFLQGGAIMFDDDVSVGNAVPAEAITAANIAVSDMQFDLSGEGVSTSQPRVTIVVRAASAGTAADVTTRIDIQTTISPRIL